MRATLLFAIIAACTAFNAPVSRVASRRTTSPAMGMKAEVQKLAASGMGMAVLAHAEAAHAKSVVGVNGALDFGPLAGNQPGGEGTGKALGVNDDSLFGVLLLIPLICGLLFAQWQGYQDDDEDFFDSYDSRRLDKDITNRNRV